MKAASSSREHAKGSAGPESLPKEARRSTEHTEASRTVSLAKVAAAEGKQKQAEAAEARLHRGFEQAKKLHAAISHDIETARKVMLKAESAAAAAEAAAGEAARQAELLVPTFETRWRLDPTPMLQAEAVGKIQQAQAIAGQSRERIEAVLEQAQLAEQLLLQYGTSWARLYPAAPAPVDGKVNPYQLEKMQKIRVKTALLRRGMQEQGEQVNAIVKRVTEAAEKAGAAVDAAGRAVTKQVTLLMNTLNSWSSH